jgi:hypothetical protein
VLALYGLTKTLALCTRLVDCVAGLGGARSRCRELEEGEVEAVGMAVAVVPLVRLVATLSSQSMAVTGR